jgi:hypothetical protein
VRSAAVLAATGAILLLAAASAEGELSERGDLFVRFSGGLAPAALPRQTLAPISIHVAGTVRTLSGDRPPALRRVEIKLNRGGRVDTVGLPVCHRGEIESASRRQALANCRRALVGGGSYSADTAFPEQPAFPTSGRILAFNAIIDGRRAVLAHVYGPRPVPSTRIITFYIRRTGGTYGTVLTGLLSPSLNRWGYVRRIALSLHRRFRYRGRPRSYLSAACPAPAGFPGALFRFARASMGFADGRTLSSILTRSCEVRGD